MQSGAVLAFIGLFACTVDSVRADDWPGAVVKEVFSRPGTYMVRITPGKSYGDTFGFAGSPKGPYATAELHKLGETGVYSPIRSFTLLNPVAPIDSLVTVFGRLVTFDNWHNMGYGKVMAIYNPEGTVVRSYTLEDLFSQDEIKRIEHSVSSRWWRKSSASTLKPSMPEQRTLCVATVIDDRNFEFDLKTGAFTVRKDAECRTPIRQ